MTWVDWFFWISLALFIWQFVAAWRMESDHEWYKKHPRDQYEVPDNVDKVMVSMSGGGGGGSQPPKPPDLSHKDIIYNMPPKPGEPNGRKPR